MHYCDMDCTYEMVARLAAIGAVIFLGIQLANSVTNLEATNAILSGLK